MMIMIILRCDLIITTSINWWTADAGSVLEPWVEDNNARRPLGKAELPLLHLLFLLFLLHLLFILLNLFAIMAVLYLQVKQIQRRSILCILLPLNQFMWTECSNDSCIFFLLKNILFLHGLGSNKLHWGFQSFRSNGDSTLHLNKQSRAGLETLPTVFPSCQMQVHLSLLRHERSESEKRRKELSNILT